MSQIRGRLSGAPRIGDFVSTTATPPVRGQIVGGTAGAWVFQPSDPAAEQQTLNDSQFKPEGFSGRNNSPGMLIDTAMELGGNALVYGIIQKIRSNPTFGHRFWSFVMADASYELVLRTFMDRLIPFMRPDSISNTLGVTVSDFQDALKAVPVTVVQQIICKLMYKQGFTTHVLKNLLDSFIAYSGSNLLTRNVSAFMGGDNNSKFVYRY